MWAETGLINHVAAAASQSRNVTTDRWRSDAPSPTCERNDAVICAAQLTRIGIPVAADADHAAGAAAPNRLAPPARDHREQVTLG